MRMVTSCAALQGLFAMGFERLALFRLELGRVRQQRVEAAELRDQIDRALLADAGARRRRCRWCRRRAPARRRPATACTPNFLDDAPLVEPGAVLARVVDADRAIADELEEVLVDRDDRDLEARLGRRARQLPITSSAS